MNLKFGTDGIRGPVETKVTPEACLRIGHAAGIVFKDLGWDTVLIGKDTRVSGYMLEAALQAGFLSVGMNVRLLGPLPTPGVAYLTKSFRNQCGVVISASHNDYQDNDLFNKNDFLCANTPTPANGSTPAREVSTFRGEGRAYYPQHFPIPASPPHAARTPHIHGATACGAPNSSGGLMMMI